MKKDEKHFPVVFFVYNRPEHTKKTIDSLLSNKGIEQTDLFIFSDGSKDNSEKRNIAEVRQIIASIVGVKSLNVVAKEYNTGLASSIIAGVSEIINKYGSVIVLEDDLVLSPYFLSYMNQCLQTFQYRKDIFSISGYSPLIMDSERNEEDIFLSFRGGSWGWATWKDRWNSINWEEWKTFKVGTPFSENYKKLAMAGDDVPLMLIKYQHAKINSWAIRFLCHALLHNKLHIMPVGSKVKNIGHDESGTHSPKTTRYDVLLDNKDVFEIKQSIELSNYWVIKNKNFFKKSFIKILYHYIRNKFF